MEYETRDSPLTHMLEDALLDPYERKVLDKVNDFSASPYSFRYSNAQVEELVGSLNEQWTEMEEKEVQITGLMQFPVYDRETGEPTGELSEKRYVKLGQAYVGNFGVQSFGDDPVIVDGEVVRDVVRRKIVLRFYFENDVKDDENDTGYTHGLALPSEVIFSKDEMTVDQSIAYVHYFYKETAQQITDILDVANDDEELITMALKDVTLDLNPIDSNEAAEAFSIYINEFLHYDRGVPYASYLSGQGVIEDENDNDNETVCTFHGIALIRPQYVYVAKLENEASYKFYLTMYMVNGDESMNEEFIRMPLCSIDGLKSIRRIYHTNREVEDLHPRGLINRLRFTLSLNRIRRNSSNE